jgi:tetratricopeptide (TPR) repeat protein
VFGLGSVICAQGVDEVSEVTGLPIPIGSPVIYGQVMIKNVPRDERRPVVYVSLRNGGAQIDRYQANDRGYWYFLKPPGDGQSLVFEVDGAEIGQSVIAAGGSNRFRQDIELDYKTLKGANRASSGVISARDKYPRNADAEKAFENAAAARAGNADEAVKLFNAIVQKDEKDFNAWMQLGTLHYGAKRYDEARSAYARATALKPDYFLAYLNIGKLELSQKNYDPATAAFSKAVEIDPKSADANHLLGETYLQNKKGSMAVGFLNKAIDLAPVEKADIHLRLAALYNAAGYKDRAALEYKAFLGKVKEHPDKKKFEQYIKDNPPKS